MGNPIRLDFVLAILERYRYMERIVLGSGISSCFDRYIYIASRLIYTIMFAAGLPLFILLTRFFSYMLALLITLYILFAVILPASIALTLAIPYFVYKHRGTMLETKFMIFALYLSSIVAGGANLSQAFRELATTYIEQLKPFSLELKLIVSRLSIGEPIDSVLDYVASITPSPSLRELLQALAAGSRVGVALLDIINTSIAGYLDRYSIFLERETTSLAVVLDSYTTVAMTVPIIVGTAALLFSFIGGFAAYMQMIIIVSFVVLPLASLVTLLIADAIASRLRL